MKKNGSFIQLNDLVKTFNGSIESFKALDRVNLSVKKGEFIVICGKSGSGKSTLLNMISGIDHPTSGEIWIDRVPLQNLGNRQLAKWRGKNTGIVFQFFQLMPTLNVLENVLLPMEFVNTIPMRQQRRKASDLLEKVGVAQLAGKFPSTLSGGEKQRVAIARALANNPELIIADEPTGNLDTENTSVIHSLFNELADEGKTIVYVTHEAVMNLHYSRQITMSDGKVAEVRINQNSRRTK